METVQNTDNIPWGTVHDILDKRAEMATVPTLLASPSLPDGTYKFLLRDARGRRSAVLILSSPASPMMVARAMDRAMQAKDVLGPVLGGVILTPLATGETNGRTFAILPYCRPLSENKLGWLLDRQRLRPMVFRWLRHVTEVTASAPPADRIQSDFVAPLQALADNTLLDADIRNEAIRTADQLDAGRWKARYVLAHNDLWKGNILKTHHAAGLLGRAAGYQFVLIDWPGSALRGYAMYDLVRLARSMQLSAAALAGEVIAHCTLLQCEPRDALSHLLVSLGAMGMNLEQFPVERYVAVVRDCCNTVRHICAQR